MIHAATLIAAIAAGPAYANDFPFNIGGAFSLVDQFGVNRTQVAPDGHLQLLFFGYANCEQICSASLPLMADIVDELADVGLLTPVMITVDAARDTVANIGQPLAQYHPDFVGLTGSEAALQIAYDAFSVEKEVLFTDPAGGEVFAHGSFLYLLDSDGEVLTLVPPVMDVDQAVGIITPYLSAHKS
ncbi:SCO family protein [Yoonia sediminilitoris]|uniref:Protein SCO1/2 n=1 Tax=Yoonia sediminilitoris TaxID=1286148 RepID=A0A2T6KJY3_9RHOB|nr:SCO family protein [Yoonia sediminilitoris]PUB16256.1 protein SCO1/2 [Yoonia sediminilitoris]RCW96605.1 protein SCO1/2 [Yoonia sediminilitoris]